MYVKNVVPTAVKRPAPASSVGTFVVILRPMTLMGEVETLVKSDMVYSAQG
jgi:hypothetical protein